MMLTRVYHYRNFVVRAARESDAGGVETLVSTLDLHENLLADLKQFNKARRDNVSYTTAIYIR